MEERDNRSGLTIYGQVAIDHIANITNDYRIGDVRSIFEIGRDFQLIFKPGSWIATRDVVTPWFFGPMAGEIRLGSRRPVPNAKPLGPLYPTTKVTVPVVQPWGAWTQDPSIATSIAELGDFIPDLGGGGPNNLRLLTQVFGKIPRKFIATYNQEPATRVVRALQNRATAVQLMPLYEYPPINIVLEGAGRGQRERIVLRSPFPPLSWIEPHEPLGAAVLVNTVYNKLLAIEALIIAGTEAPLGVISLTESLCSKSPLSEEENSYLQKKYGVATFGNVTSVYRFILEHLLPESNAILVLNEAELNHLTPDSIKVVDEAQNVFFNALLAGLKFIRGLRIGQPCPRIYMTLGEEGSLCLDEDGVLHYCGAVKEDATIVGKNGIGDVYAATLLAYEHVGRNIKRTTFPVPIVITAATAAAAAGVYGGFNGINVASTDTYLTETWRHYLELGEMREVCSKFVNWCEQLDLPPDRVTVDKVNWEKIAVTGKTLAGWTTLEDAIGKEWLIGPFANGTA